VHRLIGDLSFGESELADDVVGVGDPGIESAGNIADGAHQRPVGAIADEESEDADILLPHQIGECLGAHFAGVGHAVGHQHHAGHAVVVHVPQRGADAFVEIGRTAGLKFADAFAPVAGVFRRGGDPAAGQLPRGLVEGDDAEAVVRIHRADAARHAVTERADLVAPHAARHIEHEDIVGAAVEPAQVGSGSQHQHKGAGLSFGAVRDDLQATREFGELVVEDEIPPEFAAELIPEFADAGFQRGLFGDGLLIGRPHRGERPGRLHGHMERRLGFDPAVAAPESGGGGVLRIALFERVDVAHHAGVGFERLVIDEADLRFLLRLQVGDREAEVEISVFLRQRRVVALVLLFAVNPFGLGFGHNFTVDGPFADEDAHLGEARRIRHRERVNRLDRLGIRIPEALRHLGHGKTVVDDDADVVADDVRRFPPGSGGGQRPRRHHRRRIQHQERREHSQPSVCSFHDSHPFRGLLDLLFY